MSQVTIKEVSVETVTKGRNVYQVAQVSFTNAKGEPKEKKIMSFSNPAVFKTVQGFKGGEVVEVTYAKDDPYFNWASATLVGGDSAEGQAKKTYTPSNSNYETREERVLRQLHIVRQSSVSSAVAALAAGAKAPVKVDDVKEFAQELVDFVYSDSEANLGETNFSNEEVS